MEAYEKLERELFEWNAELAGEPRPVGGRWSRMVACNSGTAALHLALEALELPKGSEVLLPDFTMMACARAVVLAGLKPIFVDCGQNLLVQPDLLEKAIASRLLGGSSVSAIMAVHIYGRRCDMRRYHELADKYGLVVIEDLAEAHGAAPHQSTSAACWSFYRNKIVAGEEGGAVLFNNPRHAEIARELRCLGFTSKHDFNHRPYGHNYRLANSLAYGISLNLSRFEQLVELRRGFEALYDAHCPTEWKMPARQAPWVYDVRLPSLSPSKQDALVERLNGLGVAARHGFKPLSGQAEFCKEPHTWNSRPSMNAMLASFEIIYLPLTPGSLPPSQGEEGVVELFELMKRHLDYQPQPSRLVEA